MKISMFGIGYVGLVTGACLADVGHSVICCDVDTQKIARLSAGSIPIYEPGLADVVSRNVEAGTLRFSTDVASAVAHAEVQFVAVGTPADENGAADLHSVLSVADSIGRLMTSRKIIVVKSTVPVGTSDKVRAKVAEALVHRATSIDFDVVSNPEFLKEGSAINDFLRPDRIIIGATTDYGRSAMRELYEPFNRSHDRTIYMDVRSAELTKYAANAMLATKISLINEIANMAELLGADIEQVRRGMGADPRIGYDFIYPGLGYGGSCFPKDVQALIRIADDIGYDAPLLAAVEQVNNRQKTTMFNKISDFYDGAHNLTGKQFAVWGLSFKPNTDDMREAPSRVLLEALWEAGATVVAYDPAAMPEAARIYADRNDLRLGIDKYSALDGADALLICTEWAHFRAPDFAEMAQRLGSKVIFDGRNLYQPQRLLADGWDYISVGRPSVFSAMHDDEHAG